MIEVYGNLWDEEWEDYWKVILTNSSVKTDGRAVMGKGCALEASLRFPDLPFDLGFKLQRFGNSVYEWPKFNLMTFPTKYSWWNPSNINLIINSAKQLTVYANRNKERKYILPRPGCGYGGLKWEEVKPEIEGILPDNVFIITFKEG